MEQRAGARRAARRDARRKAPFWKHPGLFPSRSAPGPAMPESAPGRAPAGAGGRAKGAYQDRDKPAQIRFSNIAAGKGAAAAGGAAPGPAWAAIGAGAMDRRGWHRPGRAPGCERELPGCGVRKVPRMRRWALTRAPLCSFVSAQS